MPPKRTTPVTKRNTEDSSGSSHLISPSPLSLEDHSSLPMGFQLPLPPPSPPLPTHIPPSPPRQHIHTHHLHHQHSYPHPLPQPIPMLFDPPSPTNESPQRPAPVPLHIMIQRALSSPGPAQPHPDGLQRAHTLLFETPPEYQSDRGRPLPVSIQPLKLWVSWYIILENLVLKKAYLSRQNPNQYQRKKVTNRLSAGSLLPLDPALYVTMWSQYIHFINLAYFILEPF